MTIIDKIRKLLIDVNNELDYISLADTDNAIYQVGMNNYERIKNMTLDEMAAYIKQWLQQESEG